MGARLVASALVVALPKLKTHAARVALLTMAHHAKDTDSFPMYFAGSDTIEEALGYPPHTDAGRKAVMRAMRELVTHGYVESSRGTRRSYNRRWRLHLHVLPRVVESAE